MYKRYFRKKDARSDAKEVKWIEMTGKEYYRFVSAPENKGRRFIDMGDVVLECTEAEYKKYKAEDDHSSYILEQEADWITQSLELLSPKDGLRVEELIADISQDVEGTAFLNLFKQKLNKALACLTEGDFQIIDALYLQEPRKTLRQLSAESGIPVMTLQDRKVQILSDLRVTMLSEKVSKKNLKKIPYKFKKSSQ